jgi:tetratricopeptide (TPR) repeat protein
MAIRGSLKEASLADVLQLLALGQKTGCLSVIDRNNIAHLYFDRGRICYASIVNRRDRLGDILLKNGRISQNQLDRAVARQEQEREKRLGELLIDEGAISRSDLEHYMRVQIQEAVYFLFTWTRGTFNFETDLRPEGQDVLVSINPESLLLEGARRVDEWSLIEKKIPSFDLVFSVEQERLEASAVELTEVQRRILPLLDGQRDVQHIVEESGLGEFEVGKGLFGLITAGFAHRIGRSQAVAAGAEGTEARVEEHRNLGLAFYRTGMLDEAGREFRRVAELRPTDGSACFYLGLVALKQARWDEAADLLSQAAERGGERPAVLHNLAYALERTGRLDDAEAMFGDAAARARHDARHLVGWGITALQRGDPQVAAGRLDRAREVWGAELPAIWYWARSLAAAGEGEFGDAERLLREGLERYPHHAILQNNLAALVEIGGDLEGAQDLIRAALADDPSVPQLSKNLGDLLYRSGRYDDAWEAYKRAVKLQPDLGDDVYFKLGNIAYKRMDRDMAGMLWRQALELNPGHELARANLETMNAVA